jgi:ATP-dependent DNA helicase RecQ
MADINLLTIGASRKIRSRFQVLRRPESSAATAALAAELHTQAQQLEERELQRLHAAWTLLCTAGGRAISAGLSQHFGDPAAATAAATAADSSTGTQWGSDAPDAKLSAVLQLPQPSAAHMDAQWAAAVRALPAAAALPQPYEAALVAKFAAGIKSPRVVRLRLSKEPGFGSCADCPFPEVLQRAERWVAAGAAV